MFYIKSDKSEKGYYNSDYNYWESDIKNATEYYTYDIAQVIAEMIWVDNNIQTEVVGQIGEK